MNIYNVHSEFCYQNFRVASQLYSTSLKKSQEYKKGGVFCRNLGGLSVFKSHLTKRTWQLNLQLQYKDDHCFCGEINCMCFSSSMYVDSLQRSAFSKSISAAVKVCFWLRKYPKGLLQFGFCKPGKQLKCNYVSHLNGKDTSDWSPLICAISVARDWLD